MTDIVERLRAYWPDGPGYQIAWEAADEIERLRAELERIRGTLQGEANRLEMVCAEPKP